MKLEFLRGRWRQALDKIEDLYTENPFFKIVVDLLVYAPITLISIYMTVEDAHRFIDNFVGADWSERFNDWGVYALFLSLVLLYMFKEILPIWLKKDTKATDQLTLKGALVLLNSLESIVDAKRARFEYAVANLDKNQGINSSEIFKEITRPEQQILFSVTSLQLFLEGITENVSIDVRLVEVKDKKAVDWYAYAPSHNPPKTPISELSDGDSALAHCAKSERMLVIPDITKESKKSVGRKYKMLDPEETGSVICYPIYHEPSKTYPFIITIRADKANLFNPKKQQLYRWILGQFAKRIQLEFSLVKLKEATRDE